MNVLLRKPIDLVSSALALTRERTQTRPEELANTLSHGLGLIVALGAGAFLIQTAIQRGNPGYIFGASVYAATMIVLYLASTLYHSLPVGRAKSVLLVCDHSAIYLFIAGSYTPFVFGVLRGPWGVTLGVVVWGLALAGVAFKLIFGADRYPVLSTLVYMGMGWAFLLAAGPVWRLIPAAGLEWILAGGVAYTLGVAFFRAEQIRYAHFAWHLFVLAGTACHYIAVLRYAAG